MSRQLNSSLSSDPILDAGDAFRGSVIDMSRHRVVGGADLSWARDDLAARLKTNGLSPGDRVVLAVANGPQFPVALAAILKNGASPLLLHCESPLSEVQRTASRFHARFHLTDRIQNSDEPVADSTRVLEFDDWLKLSWSDLDSDGPSSSADFAGVPLHPTSGSTGSPKVALRPGPAAIAEADHYVQTLGVTTEDMILALTPMSHAYAYGMGLMVPLVSGASVATMDRFSLACMRRALQELPITILPSTPAILESLVFSGAIDLPDSLRWVLTAGSLLSQRTAREFRSASGLDVHPLYGTTETGGISIGTTPDAADIAGWVGPAMRGVEADVRPVEDASAYGTDVGRLWIRSGSMMSGYLDENDCVTSPLEDGWFQTGDLAMNNIESGIQLRGRDNDVINVLGMKVIPCEVEEVLSEAPGVQEVAVYSRHLRSGAETVKAAVVLLDGTDVAGIRQYCRNHLVYYKQPAAITVVESLPRTPAGKINRNDLP